jgi:hypothetical protein
MKREERKKASKPESNGGQSSRDGEPGTRRMKQKANSPDGGRNAERVSERAREFGLMAARRKRWWSCAETERP